MRSLKQAYPLPLASFTEKMDRQGVLVHFEKMFRRAYLSLEQSKEDSTVSILLISSMALGQVKWPSSMTESLNTGLGRELGTSDIEVERDTCRRHGVHTRLNLIS